MKRLHCQAWGNARQSMPFRDWLATGPASGPASTETASLKNRDGQKGIARHKGQYTDCVLPNLAACWLTFRNSLFFRGSWASPCNNRSKSSSFSLFRKLGGGGGGGGGGGVSTGLCATPKWNPIRGTTCNSSQQGGFPSECYESPYPVSTSTSFVKCSSTVSKGGNRWVDTKIQQIFNFF